VQQAYDMTQQIVEQYCTK